MGLEKDFQRFYGNLPLGVLVLTKGFKPIYSNSVFDELMERAKFEFGSVLKAQEEFISACKVQQNKDEQRIMRIMGETSKDTVVIRVKGTMVEKHRVYTVVADQNFKTNRGRNLYIFGRLRVDIRSQSIFYNRDRIATSEIEFKLMAYLCAHEEELLTKEALLKQVWGKRSLNTRTPDVYISRLKKKLGDGGCPPEVITTVHGRGYIFSPKYFD